MSFSVNRRLFMHTMSTALAVGALSSVPKRASAKSDELRVAFAGGNFGQAVSDAYVKPFEAATGIKVTQITQDLDVAPIAAMVKAKSVTVDVVLLSQVSAFTLAKNDNLEKIDYSIYNSGELGAIEQYCKQPYGFGCWIYSMNLCINGSKFPAGKPKPNSWANFWDVKNFPGVRALRTGQYGSLGPFEEALIADGVNPNAVYPMDIDRVFASLDKIKPHIRKWWLNGSEILQIMRDNVADMVQAYDGRAQSLIDAGQQIEIVRNQGKLAWDNWIIPRGAPNLENAQKFIEFSSHAERQAAFSQLFALAPSNRNAYKLIPEEVARKLATHPDYLPGSYFINVDWYAQVGPDGLSNSERLIQRWNEWILK
ncbi:ABC transporter substrate-binding protein [Bradyrhizobium sp. DN5]|uniref:ABC transporter substrate-binding protein n=1 Tax=Bradyrhizobium sp. DN5 TaxID=3056950 RepID=UPI00352343CB